MERNKMFTGSLLLPIN